MNNMGDALSDLGLDTLYIKHPVQAHCSKTVLEAEYSSALATAEAARRLGMGVLKKQCRTSMEYICAIAMSRNKRLTHHVDGPDIAEMLALLDEEERRERQYTAPGSDGSDANPNPETTPEHPDATTTATATAPSCAPFLYLNL